MKAGDSKTKLSNGDAMDTDPDIVREYVMSDADDEDDEIQHDGKRRQQIGTTATAGQDYSNGLHVKLSNSKKRKQQAAAERRAHPSASSAHAHASHHSREDTSKPKNDTKQRHSGMNSRKKKGRMLRTA